MDWQRVSHSAPCPVCGRKSWCTFKGDPEFPSVVMCARIESDHPCGDAGWLHVLNEGKNGAPAFTPTRPPEDTKRLTDEEYHAKWHEKARKMAACADEDIDRLAKILGVTSASLRRLNVGFGLIGQRVCWSFPERSGRGHVVGINRRYPDGAKITVKGCRRGLVYADDWDRRPGPVFVVEGGSDTAALLSMGLCAVGRPSNRHGADDLKVLFGRKVKNRPIVVLGEFDKRRHEELPELTRQRHNEKCAACSLCWPGWYGAKRVTEELKEEFGERVWWRMPPDRCKDVRQWLISREVDLSDENALRRTGRIFVAKMRLLRRT